ncbi:MAG TPA: NUDIX hydrolase [Candidatus Saccharimonadales bacterium]|nr:NUDIX hydrolase [Candidatus Saccharimonadales bacterium]
MNREISVVAVVFRDGKLLCVRLKPHKGETNVSENEWWCLPGGGLEDGEGLIEGLKREMIEETGVRIDVGNLLYIQQYATANPSLEHLEFFFHVKNANDFLNIDLSKTSHGETEIAEIKFVDPITTTILPDFLTTVNIATKIQAEESPTLFNLLTK